METWTHVGTIESSRGAPIHLAAFDPAEELLWSASQAGMVYSHLMPTAEPYSAFRAEEQMPVVALLPHPFGVITLNHDRVRFFSKGGMRLQEVKDEKLQAVCGGALVAGKSAPYLACAMAPPDAPPALGLLDLNTAELSSVVPLEAPASIVRFAPALGLLCLAGADGRVALYDVRQKPKPTSTATLFPRGVVADMDCSLGHSLAASALRSQLGPLGQNEFVYDAGLRTLDLRAPQRPGAHLQFAPGAARLLWHPAAPGAVVAASPGGTLQQLDARGHFTAPQQLVIEPVAEGGAQLLSLAIASTAQMLAAGDSSGALHVCATTELPPERLHG